MPGTVLEFSDSFGQQNFVMLRDSAKFNKWTERIQPTGRRSRHHRVYLLRRRRELRRTLAAKASSVALPGSGVG
jgi:hypothetical protein